jgi:hypothetical protein
VTVTIDHGVVDGGPAARFGADMRRLIEQAIVLRGDGEQPSSGERPADGLTVQEAGEG